MNALLEITPMEVDWPAPKHVRAIMTTRGRSGLSGSSTGSYAYFNLGDKVGEDPQIVRSNRQQLEHYLGSKVVFLNQVHGRDCVTLDSHSSNGIPADASLSKHVGMSCAVLVADCLPVLLCDTAGTVVAAVHCGWRGLCAGVLENTLAAMDPEHKDTGNLLAWLGPCIGAQCFEVGPEVRECFVAHDPQAQSCFVALEGGKFLGDLAALARMRLAAWGITRNVFGNDSSARWCTVQNSDLFYSYRRSGKVHEMCGRMAACIALTQ